MIGISKLYCGTVEPSDELRYGRHSSKLPSHLLQFSKDKKQYVTGRCSWCKWLDICAGNFRVRAEAETGDQWASDPACYLTDEEIGRL